MTPYTHVYAQFTHKHTQIRKSTHKHTHVRKNTHKYTHKVKFIHYYTFLVCSTQLCRNTHNIYAATATYTRLYAVAEDF